MDEKFFGKKKRGGRDPALTVTGNGGGPASLDFATWTDASALPIDRRSQSVSLLPAKVIKHFQYKLQISWLV